MTVKIMEKAKAKTKAKTSEASAIAETVEEMSAMKIKMDALKSIETAYNKLRDSLKARIPEGAPTDQPVAFMGTAHKVEFSACAQVRSVSDLRELHQRLGDIFYEVVALKFTELDKYVTEEELAGLLKKEPGARQCKVKEI